MKTSGARLPRPTSLHSFRHLNLRLTVTLLVCLAGLGGLYGAAGVEENRDDLAARVVILANRDDPDSLRIARHYAEVRGVPSTNIISLSMPVAETITWAEFIPKIWNPLLNALVVAHWVDAMPMEAHDAIGRRRYAAHGHQIAALVICRGVPLRIANDPAYAAAVSPLSVRGEFQTNAGAVDSELALLATPDYPINAFVPNPLFRADAPLGLHEREIVKVARLDGPTVEDALQLVDRALAAEKTGLLGRAYIDLSGYDRTGDEWFAATAQQAQRLGFDTDIDREPATMPVTARCDAPVLYFGWYAENLCGPFALPGFRFPPGAIALHLHSYSAATLHSTTTGWTGPLIARGVTATVGNVYEPYLQFTHRPNLLLEALARGTTLVDAAFYALPSLSWQQVLIGDPLYRPFRTHLSQQLEHVVDLPPKLAGYAVMRETRRLDPFGQSAETLARLQRAQRESPSLALGLEIARRHLAGGHVGNTTAALEIFLQREWFASDEWALVRLATELLRNAGQPAKAVALWQLLFRMPAFPVTVRDAWLPEAIAAAHAAGDAEQTTLWENELSPVSSAPR